MSVFEDQEFELRPEHVKLLRAANITWYEIETGAPANRWQAPLWQLGRLAGCDRHAWLGR